MLIPGNILYLASLEGNVSHNSLYAVTFGVNKTPVCRVGVNQPSCSTGTVFLLYM